MTEHFEKPAACGPVCRTLRLYIHVIPHCPTLICALYEYLEPASGFTNPTHLFAIPDHSPPKRYYGFWVKVVIGLG